MTACWRRASSSCERARERISLPIKYGKPKTARMNIKNGLREGRVGAGLPSGNVVGADRPLKNAEKADGVSAVASAGSGRPVNFAIKVLNHRINVKMPRTEPNVLRRLPNCSATDTIAKESQHPSHHGVRRNLTKK